LSVTISSAENRPLTSSRQTEIAVCFGEDPQVQQVQDAWIMQGEDAFEDQNVRRIDGGRLVKPRMLLEGIHRDVGLLSLYHYQLRRMNDHGVVPTQT